MITLILGDHGTMSILSVQSYVGHGYVGNRIATFVLERLGFEVWAIPTVIYSNHPGHGHFVGEPLAAETLAGLIEGAQVAVTANSVSAILTGYMGTAAQVSSLAVVIEQLTADNKRCIYLCDPAIGNEQGLFVEEAVAQAVCKTLIPLARIITPNRFELEYLMGRELPEMPDILEASQELLTEGLDTIVVTSVEGSSADLMTIGVNTDGAWVVTVPRLDGPCHGAGDLLSSLLIAHFLNDVALAPSMERAISVAWGILLKSGSSKDLALVSAQDQLLYPARSFSAQKLL